MEEVDCPHQWKILWAAGLSLAFFWASLDVLQHLVYFACPLDALISVHDCQHKQCILQVHSREKRADGSTSSTKNETCFFEDGPMFAVPMMYGPFVGTKCEQLGPILLNDKSFMIHLKNCLCTCNWFQRTFITWSPSTYCVPQFFWLLWNSICPHTQCLVHGRVSQEKFIWDVVIFGFLFIDAWGLGQFRSTTEFQSHGSVRKIHYTLPNAMPHHHPPNGHCLRGPSGPPVTSIEGWWMSSCTRRLARD